MPTAAKPLFRPEALRPKLSAFIVPPAAVAARLKLAHWVKLLGTKKAEAMKETELLGDFIADVFGQRARLHRPGRGGGALHPQTGSDRPGGRQVRRRRPGPVFDRRRRSGIHRRRGRQRAARPARPALRRPQAVRRRSGASLRRQPGMRLVSRHQPARNPPLSQGTRPVHLRALRDGGPGAATTRPSAGSSSCWARSGWSARPAAVTSTTCCPSPGASVWN